MVHRPLPFVIAYVFDYFHSGRAHCVLEFSACGKVRFFTNGNMTALHGYWRWAGNTIEVAFRYYWPSDILILQFFSWTGSLWRSDRYDCCMVLRQLVPQPMLPAPPAASASFTPPPPPGPPACRIPPQYTTTTAPPPPPTSSSTESAGLLAIEDQHAAFPEFSAGQSRVVAEYWHMHA